MAKSYYNHNQPDGNEFVASDDLQANEQRELQKLNVKIAKITTQKTFAQIAADCNISVSQAKALWKETKESEEYDLGNIIENEMTYQLHQLELIITEAWKEYHASGMALRKEKTESGITGKGTIEKETVEIIQRNKKMEFLNLIRQTMSDRAELLGLKKKIEMNFTQNNNNIIIEGSGNNLVPDEHAVFLGKPNEVQEGVFTDIDEDPPALSD